MQDVTASDRDASQFDHQNGSQFDHQNAPDGADLTIRMRSRRDAPSSGNEALENTEVPRP